MEKCYVITNGVRAIMIVFSKYFLIKIWSWKQAGQGWAVPSSVKLEVIVQVVVIVSNWSCNQSFISTTIPVGRLDGGHIKQSSSQCSTECSSQCSTQCSS